MLLWLPRMTLGRLFRPVNAWMDQVAADVEFLVEEWRKENA